MKVSLESLSFLQSLDKNQLVIKLSGSNSQSAAKSSPLSSHFLMTHRAVLLLRCYVIAFIYLVVLLYEYSLRFKTWYACNEMNISANGNFELWNNYL